MNAAIRRKLFFRRARLRKRLLTSPSFAGRVTLLAFLSALAPAIAAAQDTTAAPAPIEVQSKPTTKAPATINRRQHPARTKGTTKSEDQMPPAAQKSAGPSHEDKGRGARGDAPAQDSPADSQPLAPKTQPESVGELQSVIHARNAKLTTCMDNVIRQSGHVIDRPHNAISTWATDAPNENAFQSIIGLNYGNSIAPNGLALIFAAPVSPNKCEGESVQIYPTSETCTKVQANLLGFGRTLVMLGKIPVVETADGGRDILMPTAGSGCVIVSVHLH